MPKIVKAAVVAALVVCGLFAPRRAAAYSVLAHEANIDALWDSTMAPMLLARFPETTPEQILEARSYAYGGCVIQDLGYYPFGSHFFSNLLHYVRTGDFVDAMIRDAQDVNEYAFALGALGHYAADNDGHPMAVNRAVPLMYAKCPENLRSNLVGYYGDVDSFPSDTPAERKRSSKIRQELAQLEMVQKAPTGYASRRSSNREGLRITMGNMLVKG